MSDSFLFYDLETWGTDPRRTRIAQFAAIRTDADLTELGDPIEFLVRPSDDLLPSPGASMVTGLAPQDALAGLSEAEAFARIADEMSRPGTCTLGYNSLRFDDEFVRHGLFRNFHDPYEREWRNGNCRWDLLDVMRLAHALRPEGIEWPRRDDGATSFRLEHLAEANGVRIGDAHEALSDVRALIGLARLFRTAQPRLWQYALALRDKRHVAGMLDPFAMTPLLHVSQRYPASRLCAAAVVPVAVHPQIGTRVIVYDLDSDPEDLLALSPEEIAARLYVRSADLPEGVARVPLKEVHTNRCPALVQWNHLRAADFERLGIDRAAAEARAARIRAHGPAIAEKVRRVFARERDAGERPDVDAALYDGFIGNGDKARMARVRATPPAQLGASDYGFQDPRLAELLFRYRARNWPDTLDVEARLRWDGYRRRRLHADGGLSEHTFQTYFDDITRLRAESAGDAARQALLDRLEDWGRGLAAGLPPADNATAGNAEAGGPGHPAPTP